MAGTQQRAPSLTTSSRPDVWSFTRADNVGWEGGILYMGYHVGSVIRSVFMWYRLQDMVKLVFCLITILFLLKSSPPPSQVEASDILETKLQGRVT